MKTKLFLAVLGAGTLTLAYFTHLSSQPSFNGPAPGCGSGGGCHTVQSGIFTLTPLSNLVVRVTVTGVASGENVAGELVDSTGTVVDVVDLSTSNVFTLTAPGPGNYLVDAGFKVPSRQWDSVRITLLTTGVGEPGSDVGRAGYELAQNFPNPFNPVTVVRYRLPQSSHVVIKLYDALGSEVRTLVDSYEPAGSHEVTVDAAGLASGVYVYRIEAGKFTDARKFVLVR